MSAPAGAGTPVKKLPCSPVGRSVDGDVEARKAQRRADREDEGGDPAERVHLIERPDIKDERRRDAEIHEIGE